MKYRGFQTLIMIIFALNTEALGQSKKSLRGKRYCEIMTAELSGFAISVNIYNSFGLNNCPSEKWDQLSPDEIMDQLDVHKVMKRGPLYWTVDSIHQAKVQSQNIKKFGSIGMRHTTTLSFSIGDAPNKPKPFEVNIVKREVQMEFAGKESTFQLTDPKGRSYIMISYSEEKIKQSLQSLAKLGSQLNLPKGWTFQVVTPSKPLRVKSQNGLTYFVQDDLGNKYIGL